MTDVLFDGARWLRIAVGVMVIALPCLGTGLLVARFSPAYILGLVGLCVAIAIAWWNRGAFAGILILVLLRGIPFVNTQLGAAGTEQGANALNDAIFVVLAAFLAVCAFSRLHNKEQDRLAKVAIVWSVCYLTWWLVKIVLGSPGIPILAAVKYGSEFMGF